MRSLSGIVAGLLACLAAQAFAAPKHQPAPPAAPAAAPEMKIVSFTGQVQIKMPDGSVVGVVPGAPIPAIPSGAEVVVVSGQATFMAGGTVVTADKGDSFSFKTEGGAVQVAAVGDKTEITVQVGKSEAKLGKGDAVSIAPAQAAGKAVIACTAGEVAVVTGGKTQALAQGQSATVIAPPAMAALPPAAPPAAPPAQPAAQPPASQPPAASAEPPSEIIAPPPADTLPPPPNPAQEQTVTNQCVNTVSPSAPCP